MAIGRAQILTLIPHQGAMCLLDEVVQCDERHILCRTRSHQRQPHPLSRDHMLPVLAGLEYGAQAMALHGALTGSVGERPAMGVIASARALRWNRARLDDIEGPLEAEARRLSGEGAQVSYEIVIRGAGMDILSGRLVAILQREMP